MSRLLILAWAPNDVANSRIGFVVSKRVAKHAVQRNYIKRLLSTAIRPLLADIPAGMDIVISARGQATNVDVATLAQDMALLFKKAKLIPLREVFPAREHVENT